MKVEDYIPYGKSNAIQRSTLVMMLGSTDRRARKMIEEARNRGQIILNDQDGSGYYISDDLDEIERSYRIERKRALMILKRLKGMRKVLKDAGRI